jgi:hypothetical protein
MIFANKLYTNLVDGSLMKSIKKPMKPSETSANPIVKGFVAVQPPELKYTISKIEPNGKFDAVFYVDIIDEATLIYMEKRYPGKLVFDGSRTFTLRLSVNLKGLPTEDPMLWKELAEKQPDIVQAFVLERLKGNV